MSMAEMGALSWLSLSLAILSTEATSTYVLPGDPDMLNMIDKCSKWGEELGREGLEGDCGAVESQPPPPGVPSQQTNFCRSAAQLACTQALREIQCNIAVENARVIGRCTNPSQDEDWECCTACLLGHAVGAAGGSCLGTLRFGTLREAAFLACCHDVTRPPPTAPLPGLPEVSSTPGIENGPRDFCAELAGELCAHTCISTPDSYRCACRPGYRLMSDAKSCSPEPRCGSCSHGCEERGGGDPVCTCPPGLYLAEDNSTCLEEFKKHTVVECPLGFANINQSNFCQDVNECEEGRHNCHQQNEICVNSLGSYKCIRRQKCTRGFRFSEETLKCEDINECEEEGEDPPCDSNQVCENTKGSFTCSCKSGFRRDPLTYACMDINECQQNLHNCHQFQRCDNTIGSYVCVRDINCGTGYTLNHQSGKCEDDNECELGTDNCRFLGSEWECHNTQGSFRCVKKSTSACTGRSCCPGEHCPVQTRHCPAGFTHDGYTCKDINECEEGTARCNANQRCVNIIGNYLCSDLLSCRPGFQLDPSKTKCIDINECQEDKSLCSHTCENRWGSFRCHCPTGYTIHTDNRTCVDINECELGVRCQGYCINKPGSYSCECPPGYRIGSNKHSCIDINECESSGKVCEEENDICINLAGSHRCVSVVCPSGYHRDGRRRTRCQRDNINCQMDDLECKRQPATYTYNFITMVSNYSIPRSGSIKLFTVESHWGTTSPDFKLELLQARVPPSTQAAVREDFNLVKQYGKATIELLRPLFGPQDIQLELKTEFYNNNVFLGVSVFNIDIYVSQYSY